MPPQRFNIVETNEPSSNEQLLYHKIDFYSSMWRSATFWIQECTSGYIERFAETFFSFAAIKQTILYFSVTK